MSQGFITGELKDSFPAVSITNPDNFISLLYYFGMLTISGTYKGKARLTIPNMVVQEQLYTYLLNTYDDADLSFSSYEKSELSSALATTATGNPTSATLPTACTAMPRSATSRKASPSSTASPLP